MIDKKLKDIFDVVFGPQNITMESSIEDVAGWDSLGHIALIMEVEKRFDIRLGFDEIAVINGVGSLAELLRRRGISV